MSEVIARNPALGNPTVRCQIIERDLRYHRARAGKSSKCAVAEITLVGIEDEQSFARRMDNVLGIIPGLYHRVFGMLEAGHVGERKDHTLYDVFQAAIGQAAQHVPQTVGAENFFFDRDQGLEHAIGDGYQVCAMTYLK